MEREERRAAIWLAAAAAVGLALLGLYPQGAEPDAGFHFLKARWAFHHPQYFVDVWARPLFQAVFAIPAQAGFGAARVFALLLALAAAWNTFRLAQKLGFENAPLAGLLLFLQPVWMVCAFDTMTEPLFALVFGIALRLRVEGHPRASMVMASLLPLARPEGFVMAALWGVWRLLERNNPRPWVRRVWELHVLATGTAAWWLAALLLSGDPLYILHHWPAIWAPGATAFGSGPIYAFARDLPEVAGAVLVVPFLVGAATLASRRRHGFLLASFFAIFILHSVIWHLGRFGSSGYPRYLICVAPATALITLAGWNRIGEAFIRVPRAARRASSAAALAASLLLAVGYVDSLPRTRDGKHLVDMVAEFRARPLRPYHRLAWSQPYACILFGRDPEENPRWTGDRERNLALLRALPRGTLVLWDRDLGESWYRLTVEDFLEAGFGTLWSRQLREPGLFWSEPREQRLDLVLLGEIVIKEPASGPPRK